jgi:predicted acylesterase/phospholipase RssA
VRSLNAVARDFTNPDILVEVVFGRDDPTQHCKMIDGVGFSCAIPGLLHYDIFRYDPESVKNLDQLMDHYNLACLVDGAAVNNVPSRVAWESVYRGVIGTRNAFILAFDSFSPRFNRNIFFLPIQRLLQINVRANLKYSTYTKAFSEVPNPFHLIGRTRSLIKMFKRGINELTPDLPFIHRMLAPISGPRERFGG